MGINNGTATGSASSRRGGMTPPRQREQRFEIADELLNVTAASDESSEDGDPSWTPRTRNAEIVRNGRSATPTASIHSVISSVKTRQSVQSRASTTASQRSVRRRRETFGNSEEPHPYGLESRNAIIKSPLLSPSSHAERVNIEQSAYLHRKESTTSTVFENGPNACPSNQNYTERVTRSSSYVTTHNNANNNKSAHFSSKFIDKQGDEGDGFISDSEMPVVGDARDDLNSSSVSYTFSSIGYYVKKVVKGVCAYIYLFIVGTFILEKWCLHVKRTGTEEGGGDGGEESHNIHGGNLDRHHYQQQHYQSSSLTGGSNGRRHESSSSAASAELEHQQQQQENHQDQLENLWSHQGYFTTMRNRVSDVFRNSFASSASSRMDHMDQVISEDEDEDAFIKRTSVGRAQQQQQEEEESTGLMGYISSASSSFREFISSSGSTDLFGSAKDCMESFWQLAKILLRLSLVILLLLLLWTYGSYLLALLSSLTRTCVEGVGSALNVASNGVMTGLYFIAASMKSPAPQAAQPIINAPNPSSQKTERQVIVTSSDHHHSSSSSENVVMYKDSEATLAALKSTQETIDALKLQIASMEQLLKDYGIRLSAHDDSFKTLQSEIEKIISAMKAASAKEKSVEQIIEEVLSAPVGETTDGTPVSLKGLFSVLKQEEDRERISKEIGVKLRALSEDIGKIKDGFNGEISGFHAEIKEINSRFENMETIVGQQKNVEPEVDIEKLKTVILPILAKEIENSVKISCETRNCPDGGAVLGGFSSEDIEMMIKRAIAKYDADKTGLPDLALESAGGSILSTRCTKSSELRNSVISYWGFRLWSPPNTPRTIIQPGVVPGECWAFEGSVGDVVIKLAVPAVVTAFTVEHIPKSISRYGHIDSAPKHFQVLGLQSEHDTLEVHDYGSFTYEDNGDPLQYFPVVNATARYYPIVELKILSNHGNMRHTCIYRFRVHGAIDLTRSQNGGASIKIKTPATEEGEQESTSNN